MANAALCAYPEHFAGGAIIAGLPYAAATSVPEAFDRMRGHGIPDPDELRKRLSGASPHRGPWPTISIWHGTRDRTVVQANAQAIIAQWSGVHGVPPPDIVRKGRRAPEAGLARPLREGRDPMVYCAVKKVRRTLPLSPSRQTNRSGLLVFSLRAM
jgi:poly(3-hydroxybutyrate) depolymerase